MMLMLATLNVQKILEGLVNIPLLVKQVGEHEYLTADGDILTSDGEAMW